MADNKTALTAVKSTGFTKPLTTPSPSAVFDGAKVEARIVDFVAKLDPSVSGQAASIYATYIGGPAGIDGSSGQAIAVDASGSAYVTGWTQCTHFPTTSGAFQTTVCNGCVIAPFVTKLNAGGSQLVYSTYLSGVSQAVGNGIAVDSLGDAYVVGTFRAGGSFPVTPDAFQSSFTKISGDFQEAFLAKINADGSTLIYSSYLGGSGDDVATVAIDQTGDAYVTGHTSSANFPIIGSVFQPTMHGTGDAFVSKFAVGETFRAFQDNNGEI
jgi:hypothetical protein